jgi:hypothetical protein
MAGKEADSFAQAAADRVREVVQSAERRADEILDEAHEEATRIRERAESEARERLDEVRRALADLEGKIGAGGAEPASAPPPPPEPASEPEVADPAAEAEDAPPAIEEQPTEEGAPSTDELIEQLKSGGTKSEGSSSKRKAPARSTERSGAGDSDAGAARLVAMKMALDGASRDEVDKHLADSYSVRNRKKLVDEVFAKASK